MAGIVYSKMVGKNDPMYGKIETPIKMLIENESNQCEKEKSITKALFNIEKSSRFGETILGQSDFDTFKAVSEGQGAENDNIETTYKKFIEHITFMKEFTITAEMVEDAKMGIALEGKSKPKAFIRSYYKTQNKIAAQALINATKSNFIFNKANVDLTVGDGLSLFHKAHPYHTEEMKKFTQANRFCAADMTSSADAFESALNVFANRMRNFKDENGEVMGYTADTLIIPGNRPIFEALAKKVIGTERTAGSNHNDINLQYGNWDIVVLNEWTPDTDKFMIMSREANKNLLGNLFFNRKPLEIHNWVDNHTWNFIWNGRCRFGVGFGTWKHMMLCENGAGISGCEEVTI
jgi:hypothetical protein